MNSEFVEPSWEPSYIRMLDAVIEYMESIELREDKTINARDILIIRSLIEFYDFEVLDNQDIIDVLDDANIRAEQLETEEDNECH